MHEQEQHYKSREVSTYMFKRAQAWWYVSILLRLFVFISGIIGVWIAQWRLPMTIVAGILTVISAIFVWRSEELRSISDSLKRRDEGQDWFGWQITREELSNILQQLPSKFAQDLSLTEANRNYYDSEMPPGSIRALECVQESAWWSKEQARRLSNICFGITVIFLAICIIVLFGVGIIELDSDTRLQVSRVVLGVFTFIASLGFAPLAMKYRKFCDKAGEIEMTASNILKMSDSGLQNNPIPAIKLMHDYQLARVGAPLLPTILYNQLRNHLNSIWIQYRRDKLQH